MPVFVNDMLKSEGRMDGAKVDTVFNASCIDRQGHR